MVYTKIFGLWNFGDCSWLGPGTNPVLFASLTKEEDGSFSNFVRLVPESVDDYNLPPATLVIAKNLPISTTDIPIRGLNFSPGGIGYCVTDLGGRLDIYRKYHGGLYPPWSPAPVKEQKPVGRLRKIWRFLWG